MSKKSFAEHADPFGATMGALLFWLIMITGWITHLYVCFTEERWGFLIAGAIMFPIGVIHGFGRLMGVW